MLLQFLRKYGHILLDFKRQSKLVNIRFIQRFSLRILKYNCIIKLLRCKIIGNTVLLLLQFKKYNKKINSDNTYYKN